MKKSIIIVFISLVLLNLFISYLGYAGNDSPDLHKELLKYFTEADIIRGEIYSRSGFVVSSVKVIVFSSVLLIMFFTNIPRKIEIFCERLSGKRVFVTSIYFAAFLYFIFFFISLPSRIYLTYINEHKFGFSNMTLGHWFWTITKNFLLTLPLISISGALALLAIKKLRIFSVLIVPTGGFIIGLVMIVIYPTVILPLFYQIKPIDNPALEKRIVGLAYKSGITVHNIYVIKESDYSKHTNAFFVGFGDYKKIFLYDTLIDNNNELEIVSILAHEIGHWKYNHNLKGIVSGFVLYMAGFLLIYNCVNLLVNESKSSIRNMYSPSAIPAYLLLFIIFSYLAHPIENSISRKMEIDADYYALEITDDPGSFILSQVGIAKDNNTRLNKNAFYSLFRDSHPVVIDRVKMAERYRKMSLGSEPNRQ